MTLVKRKILFFSFVTAFFVITTLMILYAQGYRINPTWPPDLDQSLQRNGMLLVETEPKGAGVFLDGKTPQTLWQNIFNEKSYIQTPAKIKDIRPEEYTLTITKDGYHTWERKINIYPGKITTITDLRLLKKNLPLKVSENKVEKELLSPDKKTAVDIENSQLVNLTSGEATPLPAKASTSSIIWSPDSKKIIVNKKLFHIEEGRVLVDLAEVSEAKIREIKWNAKGDRIYYTASSSLYSFDPETKKSQNLFEEDKYIITYLPEDNYLYLIKTQEKTSVLEVFAYPELKKVKSIDFPLSEDYKISFTPRERMITVYDQRFQTLYLIDPLSPVSVLKESLNNVSYFDWKNGSELIYGNKFEIWKFNANTYDKQIITRLSREITEAIVVPVSGKILHYNQSGIKLVEPTNKKIDITELANLHGISDLFLVDEGRALYFNADIGKQSGLYKLNIY